MNLDEMLTVAEVRALYKEVWDLFGRPKRPEAKERGRVAELLVLMAGNDPRVKFMLDLAGLDFPEALREAMPPPPPPHDAEAAQAYVEQVLEVVRRHAVDSILAPDFQDRLRDRVLEYATHFTGKITHSKVEGARAFAARSETHLPHLSSRALLRAGINLPCDQVKLDQSKLYPAIVRVMNDDPVVEGAGLPEDVVRVIKDTASGAIAQAARTKTVRRVDFRLRQVLLPNGDDYLAVTPLASPGLMTRIGSTALALEEGRADAQGLGSQMGHRPDGKPSAGDKASAPKMRFLRAETPYGGANPQNVTIYSNRSLLQRPLLFLAPQRDDGIAAVTRFKHRRWVPFISRSHIASAAKHLDAVHRSFEASVSLSAVEIYAKGVIKAIALDADRQARALSMSLAMQTDDPLSHRNGNATDLDRCIANGEFGQTYREALAEAILAVLWRKMRASGNTCPLDYEAVRTNVRAAIQNVLEKTR